MKELKKLKEDYENIEIPKDYDAFIDQVIEKNHTKSFFYRFKIMKLALASSFIIYILCLNTIPTFAKALEDVPILSSINKVLCFNRFDEVSETKDIHIKVPEIANTGNSELEKRINKEIQTKIDEIVEETRKEAKEIEKEHLKIYQESASFVPANVNIDYKVYYQSNHILSFVINKTVIQASSYVEKMVYNLDLDSGEKLTLQSLLGNDYKTIVNTQIEKQIQERLKNDSNAFFYDDANKFTTIKDNQNFYINKEGKIVILFDKYEIAPGYMGNLEFTLINTIK